MSIVKVQGKNGSYYAIESTSRYVPGKGSRPVKKYLGRYDPDTDEIIPSSGKRGRPRKTQQTQVTQQVQTESSNSEEISRDLRQKLDKAEAKAEKLAGELEEAKSRLKELAAADRKRRRILASIRQLLDELEGSTAEDSGQ